MSRLQLDHICAVARDIDNPNVPSDLEQMPNLLNFLEDNGSVVNKQYTVLISHTAAGITSSLTGLYPDRSGLTESNSYDYYDPNTGIPSFTSGFKYWTSPVASPTDPNPNMVNGDSGQPKTTPAPWVTYTRAGCDVGNVSMANTVLENNSIAPGGDVSNVYGANSPEAAEPAAQRTTDFVGDRGSLRQDPGERVRQRPKRQVRPAARRARRIRRLQRAVRRQVR
jgi:Type I phosphodiesterase / nucleotide pyrophosphatase